MTLCACLIYFHVSIWGSLLILVWLRLLCWSLIVFFVLFFVVCLFVLSCFLGIFFFYYLLCSGPWFEPIGSSWPVLCHGWHWGVALCWCGETSLPWFHSLCFCFHVNIMSSYSLSFNQVCLVLFWFYHVVSPPYASHSHDTNEH